MKIKVRIAMTINLGDYCTVRPEVEVEDDVRLEDHVGVVSSQTDPIEKPNEVQILCAHRRIHDTAANMWEKEFEYSLAKLEEKRQLRTSR